MLTVSVPPFLVIVFPFKVSACAVKLKPAILIAPEVTLIFKPAAPQVIEFAKVTVPVDATSHGIRVPAPEVVTVCTPEPTNLMSPVLPIARNVLETLPDTRRVPETTSPMLFELNTKFPLIGIVPPPRVIVLPSVPF